MKLNRGILWGSAAAMATALMAGGLMVTVVGIDRPADADAQIGAEQGEVEAPVAGNDDSTASVDGTEQYRGGGRAGGGHAGGGHAAARGGFGHTAWGHGGYGHGGYGHGWGGRGWGGSRWGHWGGGRWAGGRYVAGPYWGWCDGRYYACNRYWW